MNFFHAYMFASQKFFLSFQGLYGSSCQSLMHFKITETLRTSSKISMRFEILLDYALDFLFIPQQKDFFFVSLLFVQTSIFNNRANERPNTSDISCDITVACYQFRFKHVCTLACYLVIIKQTRSKISSRNKYMVLNLQFHN